MDARGQQILQQLQAVQVERTRRQGEPKLEQAVTAVKAFQHARFAHTYGDLLADPRCAPAARFFLDDLYGPRDFSGRDAQFARVVPALVRLFSEEVVHTVLEVATLHALSETLDTRMGEALGTRSLDGPTYAEAWRETGQPEARERQISLIVDIGTSLGRHTRSPMLRHSLRLMRLPAQAAGLGALQDFLETGFEAFRQLPDVAGFLAVVARRERDLARALFSGDPGAPPLPVRG
ncbi:MAG: FFLEELY motif protein [Rubrivivax sp.]